MSNNHHSFGLFLENLWLIHNKKQEKFGQFKKKH